MSLITLVKSVFLLNLSVGLYFALFIQLAVYRNENFVLRPLDQNWWVLSPIPHSSTSVALKAH
jgi:hypothetical protein